jgi:hypothetical protein
MRIVLIQSKLEWEQPAFNRAVFAEKISKLSAKDDLIVLPEMCTTGFSMNAEALAEPMGGATTSWFLEQARLSGAVVTGSFICREGNSFFNRLIWARPDGELDYYDKRHLFTLAGEHLTYTAGQQIPMVEWKGWKNYNKKILLVLPNPKACRYYGLDYDTWISETTEKIKKYSNLPVEVRVKGSRSERGLGYTIYDAFDSGVFATVAMNSIAALESVLYGIPAFVSVPCAASPLALTDFSQIATPFYPDETLVQQHCSSLAYGQFTPEEIANGTAWKLLNE